jgi:uncharacterized protein (TIGR03546 family)
MLFIIQQFITFLKLLHSESSDTKIALATVLGFFSASSPALSLQGVILLLIALFMRVQFGAFLFSWLLFSIALLPLAGWFNDIGVVLLSSEAWRPFYVALQQNPVLSQTRFYNTIVLGGFVVALIFAVPLFYAVSFLLKTYRNIVVSKIKASKFFLILKSSFLFKIVGFYDKYKSV